MDMQTQAIRALTREIPTNDFGFPVGIYRIDLLPWDDYQPADFEDAVNAPHMLPPPLEDELEFGPEDEDDESVDHVQLPTRREYRIAGFPGQALQNAWVSLNYHEGYPTLDNGFPFWSRLDFEPVEAFEAFERYLQMSLGRASTPNDAYGEYDGRDATGNRSISVLAGESCADDSLGLKVQEYQAYYHQFYWGLRAHAYDLFRVAQHRKQQELRSIETQTDHYQVARRLRHRLQQYLESEEEFWDLMSPKAAIDMLKTLTQLERISAGLPAAGPANDSEGKGGTPFEILFRTVAQTNKGGSEGRTYDEAGELLDAALESEATTEVLQQLVIRAGG